VKLVRFRHGDRIATGAVEGAFVRPLQGTFFENPLPTGEDIPLSAVRLLAPVLPSKVVCIGRNYLEHAREMGTDFPEEPIIFMKPSTSVIGPGDGIAYPPISKRMDYEGELACVVGRVVRRATSDDAARGILGYTCANDVTLRDLQATDGQWARAKGFDTSCPLGPWVETDVDPSDLALETNVNGEVRQSARTSQLAFDPPELVAFISGFMTLLPGDVVLTGTPAGVGPLAVGDQVEVSIEGIGTLANTVVAG
jgi:2-keto-4-pentenoate hydratase/2-oxohepta-3-ene-1,7-dioic acid hydratase in catechol pathway